MKNLSLMLLLVLKNSCLMPAPYSPCLDIPMRLSVERIQVYRITNTLRNKNIFNIAIKIYSQ